MTTTLLGRCRPAPAPTAHGGVCELHLPLPDEALTPCLQPCRQPSAVDLQLLHLATSGWAAGLRAPADAAARTRYRWIVGHHAVFCVWRLQAEALRTAAEQPRAPGAALATAAELYDVYSVLLRYSGSCTPEQYTTTVRADMAECHPAFSGRWAREYEALDARLRRVREVCPPQSLIPLTAALQRNSRVHAAVARALVPGGASLFRQAGRRAGEPVTRDERDRYDAFFRVLRRPVCRGAFAAQLVRRLAQIGCDLAEHGPTDHEAARLPRLAETLVHDR